MTKLVNKIMEHIFKAWKTGNDLSWPGIEKITLTQKKLWPDNRKITWQQLGNNTENMLYLPEEDGFDGKPVGSVPKGTSIHYPWNEEHPVFPPAVDLIRSGLFFHLGFYRTLIIVIKSCWEKYFCEHLWAIANSKWSIAPGDPLEVKDTLWSSVEYFIEKSKTYTSKFIKSLKEGDIPQLHEIYRLFEQYGIASDSGYTNYERFKTLCSVSKKTTIF